MTTRRFSMTLPTRRRAGLDVQSPDCRVHPNAQLGPACDGARLTDVRNLRAGIRCSYFARPVMSSQDRLKAKPENRSTKSSMEWPATAGFASLSCMMIPNDPEVKANGGNPFHNVATGTFTNDQIDSFRLPRKYKDSGVSDGPEASQATNSRSVASQRAPIAPRGLRRH